MQKVRRKKYFQRSLKRNLPLIRIGVLAFLIFLILGSLSLLLFRTDIFLIKKVNVVGAGSFVSGVDMQSLVEETCLGKHILLVDKRDIKTTLLKNFRGAKDVFVKQKFPDELMLEVVERSPLVLIFNDSYKDYFIIDSEGFVLGVVDASKTNLPEVRYEGEIQVGEFINQELVPVYLDLMTSLDRNEVQASSISFYPRYVRLFIQDGIEVLIGNDKNKSEALGVIKSLVRQEKLEERSLTKIDLRYDKVIVQ